MITTPHTRPFSQPMTHHLSDAGVDLTKLEFYSTFDGNVQDLSGKQNHGTISGALWKGTGRYGQALWFDDTDDAVTLANESNFDVGASENSTTWFWFKPYAVNLSFLFSKAQAGSYYYFFYTAGGVGHFVVDDGLGVSADVTIPASIVANGPVHIACVIDRTNNEAVAYANGIAGTPGDITGLGALSNASSFIFGDSAASIGGSIDIFGNVKQALDSETIKNLYNKGL